MTLLGATCGGAPFASGSVWAVAVDTSDTSPLVSVAVTATVYVLAARPAPV